jgi:hypothetical protein
MLPCNVYDCLGLAISHTTQRGIKGCAQGNHRLVRMVGSARNCLREIVEDFALEQKALRIKLLSKSESTLKPFEHTTAHPS